MLFCFLAAGIVWADTGHRLLEASVASWLLVSAAVSVALLHKIRCDARTSAAPPLPRPKWVVSGRVLAAGLAFILGFDGLDRNLSRARVDAERVERLASKTIRIAEARVDSRRSGRWGDVVQLSAVHSVAGRGPPLPSRLILQLPERDPEHVERGPSRSDRLLWPGAWVRVGLRISRFRAARNPGHSDREHRLARRGRAARARLVKPDWVVSLSDGAFGRQGGMARIAGARSAWRRRVVDLLEREGGAGAIVGALGIGERNGISSRTREAFRRLGLSHLLAVSGLHVGFVAGLAAWLFLRLATLTTLTRLTDRAFWPRGTLPFDWALGVASSAAALYAWVSGNSISVERAALLFGLCALCRLCLRSIAPAVALAWVAVAILLRDPAALFDLGAQLSFGACAALIFAGFWRSGAAAEVAPDRTLGLVLRASRGASAIFRASIAVSLGTAPLLVQHGMALSLVAPAVNVLAIPWLGLFVLPASLLAVLLVGWLPDPVFAALMFPAQVLEFSVIWGASWLPGGFEHALLPMPILLAMVALALSWIRRGRWKSAGCTWMLISLAGGSALIHGPSMPGPPRVVFFEVGQGDASLVQGREAVLLIDTGPGPPDGSGGAELVRGLRATGVDELSVVALTHADLDHRGGVRRVLASFPVAELWLPVSGMQDASLQALAESARQDGTRVRWLAAGAEGTDRGDLEIAVLWPPASASSPALSRNDASLVLRVSIDGSVFLFTADIGVVAERALMNSSFPLAADVLKVAHHGSGGSSSAGFLEAVAADVVVVSAPCDPTRGLPNSALLERLARSSAALFWTGRDGAVIASHDASGAVAVKSWGKPRRCLR